MDCNLSSCFQLVRHTRIEINLPSPYFFPMIYRRLNYSHFLGTYENRSKQIDKDGRKPTAEKKFSKSRIFHILESRVGARDDKNGTIDASDSVEWKRRQKASERLC